MARACGVLGVALLDPVRRNQRDVEITVHVAPKIVLLSLAMAQPNGSSVSATDDDERPQTSRPSCPSTTYLASISWTRGGSLAVCAPGWWALLPKTMALPFPVHVPLRSGIASCASAHVNATSNSINAKTKRLMAPSQIEPSPKSSLGPNQALAAFQQRPPNDLSDARRFSSRTRYATTKKRPGVARPAVIRDQTHFPRLRTIYFRFDIGR